MMRWRPVGDLNTRYALVGRYGFQALQAGELCSIPAFLEFVMREGIGH